MRAGRARPGSACASVPQVTAHRGFLVDPASREKILERRLATVEDAARAVRHLAADAAASVTGHILRVDGGSTAR